MKIIITFIGCWFGCVTALAEEKHPIEVEMDKAMDVNPSTAGQTEAMSIALVKWDKLLNKHYQVLTENLEPKAATALRESQRAWVAWRDLEQENLVQFYSKMDGTMYVPMAVYAKMNITRQRALSLGRLAGLLEGRGLEL